MEKLYLGLILAVVCILLISIIGRDLYRFWKRKTTYRLKTLCVRMVVGVPLIGFSIVYAQHIGYSEIGQADYKIVKANIQNDSFKPLIRKAMQDGLITQYEFNHMVMCNMPVEFIEESSASIKKQITVGLSDWVI